MISLNSTSGKLSPQYFSFRPLLALLVMLTLPLMAWSQKDVVNTATEDGVTKRVEIPEEDLPSSIQGDINTKYPTSVFIEAFKYLDEEGVIYFYEVRIERQRKPDLKLMYNSEGKSVEEKDDSKMKKNNQEQNKNSKTQRESN